MEVARAARAWAGTDWVGEATVAAEGSMGGLAASRAAAGWVGKATGAVVRVMREVTKAGAPLGSATAADPWAMAALWVVVRAVATPVEVTGAVARVAAARAAAAKVP